MDGEIRRRYYSISDVTEMTGVKKHVLRFWESRFPVLHPRKNRAGNRAYTERDIKIVKLVQHLLKEEKFTIEGAKKHLKEHRDLIDEQLVLPLDASPQMSVKAAPPGFEEAVAGIREQLLEVMKKVETI